MPMPNQVKFAGKKICWTNQYHVVTVKIWAHFDIKGSFSSETTEPN
jgi:hypothetical protein